MLQCLVACLLHVAARCSVSQCVAVCCSVRCLHSSGALWCSVLQCVAARCSALQCVAVYCSVVQSDCSVLECFSVCRRVMQRVARVAAACCSVLQCAVFAFQWCL